MRRLVFLISLFVGVLALVVLSPALRGASLIPALAENKALRVESILLTRWVDGYHSNTAVAIISSRGWVVSQTNILRRVEGRDPHGSTAGTTRAEAHLGSEHGEIRYLVDYREPVEPEALPNTPASTYRGDIPRHANGLEWVWYSTSDLSTFKDKAWPSHCAWLIDTDSSEGVLAVELAQVTRSSCPQKVTFSPDSLEIGIVREEYVVEGWTNVFDVSFPHRLKVIEYARGRDGQTGEPVVRSEVYFVRADIIDEPSTFLPSPAGEQATVFDSRRNPKTVISYTTSAEDWPAADAKSLDSLYRQSAAKPKPPVVGLPEAKMTRWFKAIIWILLAVVLFLVVKRILRKTPTAST